MLIGSLFIGKGAAEGPEKSEKDEERAKSSHSHQ